MYLEADDRDLKAGLKKADSRIKKFSKKSQQVLGAALKVGMLGAAAGIAVGVGVLVKSVMQAADAEEMLSKLAATFGGATVKLQNQLDDFAKRTGRSRFELQGMAADMGAVFKAMGFTEEGAAALAKQTTELAVDLGSFNNLPSEDVANRLTRAYTGEFESLKALGIVITEQVLKQEMLNQGIDSTWPKLDQVSRSAVINAIIMRQTADAQGDAEKTSGSFTNQMIALKSIISDTATEIGLKLLPVVTPMVTQFGEFAKEVLPKVVFWIEHSLIPAFSWFISLMNHQVLPGLKAISDFMGGVLGPIFDALGGGVSILGSIFVDAFIPVLDEVTKKTYDLGFAITDVSMGLTDKLGISAETAGRRIDFKLNAALDRLDKGITQGVIPAIEELTMEEKLVKWLNELGESPAMLFILGLADAIGTILTGAFEALALIWNETLKPALGDFWDWITDTSIDESAGGKAAMFVELASAGQLIGEALERATEAMAAWMEKVEDWKAPDWLKWFLGESPSPLERGMLGIAKALETELTPQLGKFALQLQAAGGNMGSTTDARDYSRTTRVDQMIINNGRDEQGIMQVLRNMSKA